MSKSFQELVQEMISKAINECFNDSMVYGRGYIRVSSDGLTDLKIEHIPFTEIEEELESVVELKKMIRPM